MTGGCKDWCYDHPGMNSTEIYDPKTNTWTKSADMPLALNSHTLEILGGLPTVIGGYDGENDIENGEIFQYYPQEDVWRPHPDNFLTVPRSSPTVFQVPKELFPSCN